MWRCDPPTRLVLAIVAGLVAAAIGHPLVSLLAAIPWRPRALLVAVALAASLWGGMRVAALQHRALVPGPIDGVAVVTGAPSGDRAVARVVAGREDVLLQAPGYRPQLGGIYRVTGRLREIDPQVRDYYASQGVHLQLRGSRLVWLADRGGGWGVIDGLHRDALRRLGADGDPPADRALVAGVTLGETGSLPADVRAQFRTSGLYHLVAVSGQNVALVVIFALACLALLGVIGAPARVVAAGITVTYVLVTGAGPSIVRAGVAGSLASAGLRRGGGAGAEPARSVQSRFPAQLRCGLGDLRRGAAVAGLAGVGGGRVGGLHAGHDPDRLVALRTPGTPVGAGQPAGAAGGRPAAGMRAVGDRARLDLAAAGGASADAGRPAGGLPAVGGAALLLSARWARAWNPGPHSPLACTACAHRCGDVCAIQPARAIDTSLGRRHGRVGYGAVHHWWRNGDAAIAAGHWKPIPGRSIVCRVCVLFAAATADAGTLPHFGRVTCHHGNVKSGVYRSLRIAGSARFPPAPG
jgi:hypothetical protein